MKVVKNRRKRQDDEKKIKIIKKIKHYTMTFSDFFLSLYFCFL